MLANNEAGTIPFEITEVIGPMFILVVVNQVIIQ